MIALDANLLVYAHRSDSPSHRRAAEAITDLSTKPGTWGIPWPCVHEFLGVVTNARIFRDPTPMVSALHIVSALSQTSGAVFLAEPSGHLDRLSRLLTASRVSGAKVHDARIAAICLGHGVTELWTADRDFSYFPELRTRNPLVSRDP